MKKIVFTLVLIFAVCFFTGCTQITYYFEITQNGEVNMGASVRIDKDKIQAGSIPDGEGNAGFNLDQTTYAIREIFAKYESYYANLFKNAIGFESGKNYEIKGNIIESGTLWEYKLNIKFFTLEDYLKGDTILKADQKRLEDLAAETGEKSIILPARNVTSVRTEKKFLTQTVYYSEPTKFATYLADAEFVNSITSAFKNASMQNDATFVQTLVSTNKKMHSNANSIKKVGKDLYLHTFVFNAKEARNSEIITYYVYPNAAGWYVLAMILTGLFIIGYLVYVFYHAPVAPPKLKSK